MKDEYIAETKVVKIAKSVITKTTTAENLLCPALSKNGISPLLPEMQIEIQVILKNNKSETKKERFTGITDYLTEFNAVAKEIREGKKESEYVPFEATKQCMRIMDECRRQMGLVYPFEKER